MTGNGYEALHRGAAWLDLRGRGKLAVRGPDRGRLLHALTSNDVRGLSPGQGCYAFFLKVNGRVLADANIFCFDSQLLIDTERESQAILARHIEEYTIAHDAEAIDLTDELTTIGVEGPLADRVVDMVGVPAPREPHGIVEWPGGWTARADTTGAGGLLLFVPHEIGDKLIPDLELAGAVHASVEEARTARIENGKPRYGEEIATRFLADETAQREAIHRNKGCYLGQEVVERLRSRNLLAIELVPIRLSGADVLPAGTKLFAGGRKRGELVSSAYSPALGCAVGMAYVDRDLAAEGATLYWDNGSATVRKVSRRSAA